MDGTGLFDRRGQDFGANATVVVIPEGVCQARTVSIELSAHG
jgi:hypothetical protein